MWCRCCAGTISLKSLTCVRAQDYAERRALRGELKALAKEERSRQQKAITEARQARQPTRKPHTLLHLDVS